MSVLDVLDHGLVQLVDSMGDDLAIVNAAQSSFDRESFYRGERERGILAALMREEHGVPFEAAVLKFRLRLPLFLAAQFVKHRMSSWSQHSARYSEMEALFYVPEEDAVRVQVGKAMEYAYSPAEDVVSRTYRESLAFANGAAWASYQDALKAGVAKEVARLALPQNLYTTVTWTINVRSFLNFLRLRLDGHAQYEARVYADAMHKLAQSVVPLTLELAQENGWPKP